MPEITARDGVRLHWTERGSGPAVLLAPYWSMHPSVFDPVEAVLEHDFRVIRFDERGTGASDRTGPYDLAATVSDLESICEEAGPIEVALCLVDASNLAVRVADARPDLLRSVVCMGSAPFGAGRLEGSDSLISSTVVIGAFLQQIGTDYRGAIRATLAGANTGLSEDALKERVQAQLDYADAEAASTRAREWAHDSGAVEPGRRIGSRLHVCLSETLGGPNSWFPSAAEMEVVVRDVFPDAALYWTSDGIVSAAGEAAAVISNAATGERSYDRLA
jgi:pimeloyl-ACP methyl ester carboxylesterase